jgi:hypothetical protein
MGWRVIRAVDSETRAAIREAQSAARGSWRPEDRAVEQDCISALRGDVAALRRVVVAMDRWDATSRDLVGLAAAIACDRRGGE